MKRENSKITDLNNQRGDTTTYLKELKITFQDHNAQLFANKLNNLNEVFNFLENTNNQNWLKKELTME